jgi:hypothetical protein
MTRVKLWFQSTFTSKTPSSQETLPCLLHDLAHHSFLHPGLTEHHYALCEFGIVIYIMTIAPALPGLEVTIEAIPE